MSTRSVRIPLVLLVTWLSLAPGDTAPGQSFEEWKKRDQEALRAFQEEQRGPSAASSSKTNAAARTDPSLLKPKPAAPARADVLPASAPVVLPEGTAAALREDAGWVSSVMKDPGKFLDALEGGRPGGNVNAMIALLRQTQGPFDTNEEQAVMNQYARHAVTGSTKARKAIRQQNEHLIRAMFQRQMMIQAAWEYDFALAQAEVARRMQDEEELEVLLMVAEIQRQVMQERQDALETLAKESENDEKIPTMAELKAEEDAERTNAVAALELPAEADPGPPWRVLLGYLKCDETRWFTNGWYDSFDPELNPIVEVDKEGLAFSRTEKRQFNTEGFTVSATPGTPGIVDDKAVRKYRCSWQIPDLIPVYGSNAFVGIAGIAVLAMEVPLTVKLTDTGSKLWDTQKQPWCRGMVSRVTVRDIESDEPILDPKIRWDDRGTYVYLFSGDSTFYTNLVKSSDKIGKLDRISLYHTVREPGMFTPGLVAPSSWKSSPYHYIKIQSSYADFDIWTVYMRYKWEPVELPGPLVVYQNDPNLTQEQNEVIATHRANISWTERVLAKVESEMAAEKDPKRRADMTFQAVQMRQNIHDSKDLIESIRTGTNVKTRGPWDDYAAVTMAETSRKLREDCLRAQNMQTSYVRLLKMLERTKPEEAKKFEANMAGEVVRGIYDPGGFERAQKAIDALHASTRTALTEAQQVHIDDQAKAYAWQARIERYLENAEAIKKSSDRAIFVGSLFTGLAPGLALTMGYETACTGVEHGPEEAIKNAAVQGATLLVMAGALKVGSWSISKLLNPKVVESEGNSFRKLLEFNKYDKEMEWNKALVTKLKEKARDVERLSATGGKEYVTALNQLDEVVSVANSSALAKRLMKNEVCMLENQIRSGAVTDFAALRECRAYQDLFISRVRNGIYPQVDAGMLEELRGLHYNVEACWFQEIRNWCSRGINADRDLGLRAELERLLRKSGQRVSLTQFMEDAKNAYAASYRKVTGYSAEMADHAVTTSAHPEAFPLSWLQREAEGLYRNLREPVTPADFEKAGNAIFNKVQKALTGPDPYFANFKKACASLSKDLETKVLGRLANPPVGSTISAASRQAALDHWRQVQQVMGDFAGDRCDLFTSMRRLQQLTGSTSVTQSAAEVQNLLRRLGGVPR